MALSTGEPLQGTWSVSLPGSGQVGAVTSESVTTAQRALALGCGAAGTVGLNAVVNGKTMTGTYLAFGCGLSSGTVNLTRP
jgi:hypothetical protein